MDKRKLNHTGIVCWSGERICSVQVTEAERSSRERDAEATQDPADMAANAYTKELLISMSATTGSFWI